jgi:hypothetical protein
LPFGDTARSQAESDERARTVREMIGTSYDADEHTLVALCGPAKAYDKEMQEQLFHAVDELDRAGKLKQRPVGFVLVLDPGAPQLDANWRKRFAEQRRDMKSPRVYISIVTQSPVLRGVLTAINWVSPDPPHVESLNHNTFLEGAAWIEKQRGERLPSLRRLHAAARAKTLHKPRTA